MAFTFFFRDIHTLELAINTVLPEIAGRSKIRIWDAGCAMGPEPYTIAMLLSELCSKFVFRNIHIDASDIDEQDTFGKIIMNGLYTYDLLQRIPTDIFEKYFIQSENEDAFKVIDTIRDRVRFQKHNLLSMKPFGDGYTMIVCKNVLLHFTQEQRIDVLKMYHAALMPGGYLVLERTQQMPSELSDNFSVLSGEAQFFKAINKN
ncbi:MAG: CheR family methyltransferase [Fibrobacterota bacterium]|nr:CheR family methyltransferase [Chitinispirillaceae bacterium]